jgi:hypothetical protein
MAGTSGLIRSPPNGCIGSNPAELMIPALCRVHARYRSCLASVNTSGGANNGPKYVPEWSNPRRGLPRLTAADESRARVPRPLPSSNTRRPNQMQLIALPGSIHRPASDLSGASILQIPSSRSPGPREQRQRYRMKTSHGCDLNQPELPTMRLGGGLPCGSLVSRREWKAVLPRQAV